MKKKRIPKHLQHRMNCEQSYGVVSTMLDLSNKPVEQQVREIVFAADSILTEICKNADKIKIDMYESLDSLEQRVDIDSSQWKEFVKLACQVTDGTIKDKVFQSLDKGIEHSVYVLNLRRSFINSYIKDGGAAELPVGETPDLPNFSDSETNAEFETLLNEAVVVRQYINSVLWPSFRQMGEAAEFITDFELVYKDFKNLVDWEHYKDGGYPSENSKPRLWSILNKADYATRLMSKYGFEQITQLQRQLGMNVTCVDPHPTKNTFSESSRILSQYSICRPIDDKVRQLLKLLEYEYVLLYDIVDDNRKFVLIYDTESRVIRRVYTLDDFDAFALSVLPDEMDMYNALTCKGIKDTFEYLELDEVTHPHYIELFKSIPTLSILLHPQNIDKPSNSKRMLLPEEIELLGDEGYYGV